MIKREKQLKDPRSCFIGIGGLFLWGNDFPPRLPFNKGRVTVDRQDGNQNGRSE